MAASTAILRRPAACRRVRHRSENAACGHLPVDDVTGLLAQPSQAAPCSWYEHARGYAEMKWPHLAPKSRRSAAEALTTITLALTTSRGGAPDLPIVRRALFAWAFNPGTRNLSPPADIAAALDWIAAASQPVTALEDPAVLRAVLGACARTRAGTPAVATTQRRKRAVFCNAVGYAVEQGLLGANPVDRIQWRAPAVAETVDRRVVASPADTATLLLSHGWDSRHAHGPGFVRSSAGATR